MEEKNTTPLRQPMIEDMNIRGLCEKTQKACILNVKHFAFLGGLKRPGFPSGFFVCQSGSFFKGVGICVECLPGSLRQPVANGAV